MPRNLEGPIMRRARTSHHSGVCRKLFGPVDHDQLSRDLKMQLRDIAEQDTRRWNFNFETDTPLPGRYHWQEIPTRCSADLYLESTLVKDVDSSTEDNRPAQIECCHNEENPACVVETNQENCSSISNKLKLPCEVTPVRRKRAHHKQTENTQINAHITDFFVKRRRTSETKAVVNSFLTTSSEQAQCKRI